MPLQSNLDLFPLITGLAGGLALFLFGMDLMTASLKSLAGGRLKAMLGRVTANRFKAVFAGAVVTAVVQSSSITTVLLIGFISAGLMSLSQSIGVIMGANIGTTITAQLVAFKVTAYALVLIAAGFGMLFASKNERWQGYGRVLLGLGLVFFGMDLMSEATRPLTAFAPFVEVMQRMSHPLLGIAASASFTALVQSSSATTGVIIVLASQGLITLEAGIALAFGANIGTCATAFLAATGKPRVALQAAAVHTLFNMAGVAVWIGLIDPLAGVVRAISPASPDLVGLARLAADTPRQIANAHTLFNIANTLLFIGLTGPSARLIRWIVPEKVASGAGVKPRYLDDMLLSTPVLALDRARMELRRMGERAHDMVERALPVVLRGDRAALEALARRDDEIDTLHEAIVTYLGSLSKKRLLQPETEALYDYMTAANNLEGIGDLVETNIVAAGRKRIDAGVRVSDSTEAVLAVLHGRVCETLARSLEALDTSDPNLARQVLEASKEINRLVDGIEQHLVGRLTADASDRMTHYRIETDITQYLKSVYYFSRRIASAMVEENGAGAPSP
ncbi:MAG: Na/Pi cotransporter family protein [Rhodothermales bacterium]|nr:Na/Pi cotransporter family protein [Rhodothermales bacterium]